MSGNRLQQERSAGIKKYFNKCKIAINYSKTESIFSAGRTPLSDKIYSKWRLFRLVGSHSLFGDTVLWMKTLTFTQKH